jgi:hypothetical protein
MHDSTLHLCMSFVVCVSLGCNLSTMRSQPEVIPCGGVAGSSCPAGRTCVDDLSDDCDPAIGGADCIGVCVVPDNPACEDDDPARSHVSKLPSVCAAILFQCVEGRIPFFNECGCGCEIVD